MYDAAAEAVPMAQSGQNRKKAVVIISDGNDTSSRVGVSRSEAGGARNRSARVCGRHRRPGHSRRSSGRRRRFGSRSRGCRFRSRSPADAAAGGRIPMPKPGGYPPSGGGGRGGTYSVGGADDRVNVMALREMTDDSGGRTEIVRDAARSRSGRGQHRRRIEPAVLPRLSEPGLQGRTLAHHPRRSARSVAASARAQGLRRDAVTTTVRRWFARRFSRRFRRASDQRTDPLAQSSQ